MVRVYVPSTSTALFTPTVRTISATVGVFGVVIETMFGPPFLSIVVFVVVASAVTIALVLVEVFLRIAILLAILRGTYPVDDPIVVVLESRAWRVEL